jgi:molybdate transport repressor ModE-like protein
VKPSVKLRLLDEKGRPFLGPGPVELLLGVRRLGSISKAAKEMGLSFTKAIRILHDIEESTGRKAVRSVAGGSGGGGSELTPFGLRLAEGYGLWRGQVAAFAVRRCRSLRGLCAGWKGGARGRPAGKRPRNAGNAGRLEEPRASGRRRIRARKT